MHYFPCFFFAMVVRGLLLAMSLLAEEVGRLRELGPATAMGMARKRDGSGASAFSRRSFHHAVPSSLRNQAAMLSWRTESALSFAALRVST